MTITADEFHTFHNEVLTNLEYIQGIRLDYSGRGMYGTTCLGIVCDSPLNTMLNLGYYLQEFQEDNDTVISMDLLGRARKDQMGVSEIIYFPDFVITEECMNELHEYGLDLIQ